MSSRIINNTTEICFKCSMGREYILMKSKLDILINFQQLCRILLIKPYVKLLSIKRFCYPFIHGHIHMSVGSLLNTLWFKCIEYSYIPLSWFICSLYLLYFIWFINSEGCDTWQTRVKMAQLCILSQNLFYRTIPSRNCSEQVCLSSISHYMIYDHDSPEKCYEKMCLQISYSNKYLKVSSEIKVKY